MQIQEPAWDTTAANLHLPLLQFPKPTPTQTTASWLVQEQMGHLAHRRLREQERGMLCTIATDMNVIAILPNYLVVFAFVLIFIWTDHLSHSCLHVIDTSPRISLLHLLSQCRTYLAQKSIIFASCNGRDNGRQCLAAFPKTPLQESL